MARTQLLPVKLDKQVRLSKAVLTPATSRVVGVSAPLVRVAVKLFQMQNTTEGVFLKKGVVFCL